MPRLNRPLSAGSFTRFRAFGFGRKSSRGAARRPGAQAPRLRTDGPRVAFGRRASSEAPGLLGLPGGPLPRESRMVRPAREEMILRLFGVPSGGHSGFGRSGQAIGARSQERQSRTREPARFRPSSEGRRSRLGTRLVGRLGYTCPAKASLSRPVTSLLRPVRSARNFDSGHGLL